jgi:hypothetical protein
MISNNKKEALEFLHRFRHFWVDFPNTSNVSF